MNALLLVTSTSIALLSFAQAGAGQIVDSNSMLLAELRLGQIQSISASEVVFTDKTVSVACLNGTTLKAVNLLKADLDGLTWEKDGAKGRVCYTNVPAAFLSEIGLSTNVIETARRRAERYTTGIQRDRAAALRLGEENATEARSRFEAFSHAQKAHALQDQIATLQADVARMEKGLRDDAARVHDENAASISTDTAFQSEVAVNAVRDAISAKQAEIQRLTRELQNLAGQKE